MGNRKNKVMTKKYKITGWFADFAWKILFVFFSIYIFSAGAYNLFFRDKIASDYAELTQKLQNIKVLEDYATNLIQHGNGKALIAKAVYAVYKPVDAKKIDYMKSMDEFKEYFANSGWSIKESNEEYLVVSNGKNIIYFHLLSKEHNEWNIAIGFDDVFQRMHL